MKTADLFRHLGFRRALRRRIQGFYRTSVRAHQKFGIQDYPLKYNGAGTGKCARKNQGDNQITSQNSTEYVKSDIETANLAKRYVEEGVVGATSYVDCLHIALATKHNANLLISWNFKHIVNVVRIVGYNSVNISEGYKQIDIRSPRELMTYED